MPQSASRTVLITGAAGGVGQALARKFKAAGDRLVLADGNADGLAALRDALEADGPPVLSKAGDLRSKSYCEEIVDFAVAETERLDVLVNNAGIITRGNILETTDEDWFRTLDVNLTAVFLTCRRAIARMKAQGGGAIVNVASCWGLYPGPNHPAYITSKGAVATLSKCLGRDHAGDNIRVNAVCPNEVNTPMLRTGFAMRGFDPDTAIEELNRSVPLGRIAEPEDIADVVFFLASHEARYVVGTAVEVNGAKPVY